MEDSRQLASTFLTHAPARLTASEDVAGLEHLLRRAWQVGRERWPQVGLPADVFVRHLAQRLTEASAEGSLAPLVESLALGDLYLACACVHHVPAALEALERHFLAELPSALAYLRQPEEVVAEVCQQVRIHLLLGTAEAGPRLTEYSGRGALLSWMRVIAVRRVLKRATAVQEVPDENALAALEALPAPGADAELDLIKSRYHREFRQAVREAFAALSTEQRHLLRLHFIDRLSTTQMGALFRVNQSTVSRWLKSARHSVYTQTQRCLQERLGLSSREFASLLTAVNSQLDLSLSQILRGAD